MSQCTLYKIHRIHRIQKHRISICVWRKRFGHYFSPFKSDPIMAKDYVYMYLFMKSSYEVFRLVLNSIECMMMTNKMDVCNAEVIWIFFSLFRTLKLLDWIIISDIKSLMHWSDFKSYIVNKEFTLKQVVIVCGIVHCVLFLP